MNLHTSNGLCNLPLKTLIMALDDVLDDFDWKKREEEEEEEEDEFDEFELILSPDEEAVCIMKFAFSWQAELARLILRKAEIPSFATNTLTNNMMAVEWAQVQLYVRAEEAEEALRVLEENLNEEGEFPEE
jgi:Putative prokaryotic signal transducing protein